MRPMSDDSTGSVSQAFHQFQSGDPAAAARLWERFFPRLLGLARRTLARCPVRAADADDVVQSAFASFFQQVKKGGFGPGLGRSDLWQLLATFTVRKARRQVRRESALKRGGGRVVGEGDLARPGGEPLPLEEAASDVPASDFDLCSEELLLALPEEQRTIAILRLLGYKNREIASQIECTERKVERKLNLIRLTWEGTFPD